jgi:hypothetical protein
MYASNHFYNKLLVPSTNIHEYSKNEKYLTAALLETKVI